MMNTDIENKRIARSQKGPDAQGELDSREKRELKTDRMRFTKNMLSSRLVLLAIVLNVVYFIGLYRSDVRFEYVGDYYYKIIIGASIIYNLVFMLTAFLCSEGVKEYKRSYSVVLVILGLLQVARIFYLPAQAHRDGAMKDAQYIRTVIYLATSSLSLLAGAAVNLIKSISLARHVSRLNSQGVRG